MNLSKIFIQIIHISRVAPAGTVVAFLPKQTATLARLSVLSLWQEGNSVSLITVLLKAAVTRIMHANYISPNFFCHFSLIL